LAWRGRLTGLGALTGLSAVTGLAALVVSCARTIEEKRISAVKILINTFIINCLLHDGRPAKLTFGY
jgi:hypothetical protein